MSIRFGTKIISGQTEIVDNLESTSPIKALSAKQGKVLKDTINNIDIVWEEGEGEGSIVSVPNAANGGQAIGNYSVAEGFGSDAKGDYSHVEGQLTTANGGCSHAEGQGSTAQGNCAHAEGIDTIAQNQSEHAEGQYNKSHKTSTTFGNKGNTIHSIGIGTGAGSLEEQDRRNAVEVMQNGDIYIDGIGNYDGADFSNADTIQEVITNINDNKQNVLTAGDNITIENDVISATDTTYSAGSNISIENGVISATDTTYSAGNGLSLNGNTFSANVINNTTSDSTTNSLSAAAGKSLQDQINNLNARGKYLSIWNCTTGLAMDEPPVNPYTVETGSYFIIGVIGTTNYRPNGGTYDKDIPSTTIETEKVKPNDTYYYDGTTWRLLSTPITDVAFSTLAGSPYDNTNLSNALNGKQATLVSGTNIKTINSTSLLGNGNIAVQSTITGGASTITSSNLTANRALISNDSGKVAVSDITSTELGYLDNVTSNIQTQLNNKVDKITTASKVYATNASGNQTSLSYDAYATGNTVALRGNDGTVDVSTPYANNHAANKSYVDAAVATKSTVSVSSTGTATEKVGYITINGVQKKISGSEEDNLSITKNASDKIQTVGVIDNNSNAIKIWNGKLADLPITKDANTLYNVTDDVEGGDDVYTKTEVDGLISGVFAALYPVGSLYIGTQTTNPMTTLIPGSSWSLVATNRALWGGDGTNANITIEAGLPNITATWTDNVNVSKYAANVSGAVTQTGTGDDSKGSTGNTMRNYTKSFDASQSNPIYGKSSTVQPPAYRVNVWRRTA